MKHLLGSALLAMACTVGAAAQSVVITDVTGATHKIAAESVKAITFITTNDSEAVEATLFDSNNHKSTQAEQVSRPYILQLNVEADNGYQYTVNHKFENLPEIEFYEDQLLLTVWGLHTSYQFSIDHIKSITLVADEAGVNDIVNDKDAFTVAVSAKGITVTGVTATEQVDVYDINGRQVAASTADADGCAVITIDNLDHGVYIISTSDGKSFKFIK